VKKVKLVLSLALIIFLSGCWGSQETDQTAFVLAMGFDKGENENVRVTFQIANPKVIAGAAGQEKPFLFTTVDAPLPIAAFHLLNVVRSRDISLLHNRVFIFSEELAREGLSRYIYPLNRFRETRGTSFVFVCRGTARDFMEKEKLELEVSPAKHYEIVASLTRLHGLGPTAHFTDFYESTKTHSDEPVAPLVGINEKGLGAPEKPQVNSLGDYLPGELPSSGVSAQFLGTAVFSGGKMVGEITGDESRYLLMLRGEMEHSFIVIDDPKSPGDVIGLTLRQARRPAIKASVSGEAPVIDVELFQEPSLVGITSGINYEDLKLKKVLEKEIARLITEKCQELVSRTQDEFNVDSFGLGQYAKRNYLTVGEWEKYNWHDKYSDVQVNIKVNVRIRRTGLQLKTVSPTM
jgi:spore germination protein KC